MNTFTTYEQAIKAAHQLRQGLLTNFPHGMDEQEIRRRT